jgi:hypothetical protein
MADSGEVEMGAGDTGLVRCGHVQGAFPRRDRLLAIDVEHRSGVGHRHLQARHMHNVAPDHDGITPRFDQPSSLARRMPRLGDSGHAGKDRTVANGADAISVRRGRKPRALAELECLRRRAARRIRIAEQVQIRLVHHEFRLREDGLSVLIDEPVHVVGMKMRHQDRVDVFRLDPHGL